MPKASVMTDLQRWGPDSPALDVTRQQAEAYCRSLALSHYENFPVVSILLPKALHQHFYNVYAFCRWADDLGDESGSPERAVSLLNWWQSELEACFAGTPRHPVFVALWPTIREFDLSSKPFDDLISAFQQDQVVREYDNFNQLLDYCTRSANPVGRIVLSLVRRLNDQTALWSDSICTGLQLANFWQDVARDNEIGRVYLPRGDRERFGVTPEQFSQRRTTPEFTALMKFEVDRAREFLLAGTPLVGHMPGRLKVEIDLFRRGGLLILDAIERGQYRVWEKRPTIPKRRFLTEALKSLLHTPFSKSV